MNGEIVKNNKHIMNVLAEFKKVTTFIFDIDGVLTDGTLLVLRDGLQARQMHVKDGFGLQMAMKRGYHVFIISGGVSEESKKRLEYLGIKEIYIGIGDKTNFVSDLLKSNKIKWEEVLFMGFSYDNRLHKIFIHASKSTLYKKIA